MKLITDDQLFSIQQTGKIQDRSEIRKDHLQSGLVVLAKWTSQGKFYQALAVCWRWNTRTVLVSLLQDSRPAWPYFGRCAWVAVKFGDSMTRRNRIEYPAPSAIQNYFGTLDINAIAEAWAQDQQIPYYVRQIKPLIYFGKESKVIHN